MKNKTDITINTYDNIVKEYADYYKSLDEKGELQFQKETELFIDLIPHKGTILDAGCAIGNYVNFLLKKKEKEFQVIGIDASPKMIAEAKKRVPEGKFELIDLRKMSFKEAQFDGIICFSVLIHLDDIECLKVLTVFKKILKTNGILAINVMEQSGKKDNFGKELFNEKYKTYFNYYSKEFFKEWFLKNNFEIVAFFDNKIYLDDYPNGVSNEFTIVVKRK